MAMNSATTSGISPGMAYQIEECIRNQVTGTGTGRVSGSSEWPATHVALRCRSEMTPAERRRLDALAYTFGAAPESYDILISDGSFLMTPCGGGAVGVLPHGRYWHIPGGLLAPDALKPRMVAWLKRISAKSRRTTAFYSIGDDDLSLFRNEGYEINKMGEEPVLGLGGIDWRGKRFEWVRRQTNFCVRAGLEVVEIDDEQARRKLGQELNEILHADLSWRTYSHPLRLLEGAFDPYALHRRRLFLARNTRTSRIEGFLACSPMRNGTSWAFETYRQRPDATRGTVPFLFREVIDRLQAEGVREVSLCLVPGRGVAEDAYEHGHWLAKVLLVMWYNHLNFLFNARGQFQFKSRFRPRCIGRSICVTPGSSPFSIMSFLHTAGGFSPNYANILRLLWSRGRPRA